MSFRKELTDLINKHSLENESDTPDFINKHSLENESDTPDFILALYLIECLQNFNKTISIRKKWYQSEESK